MIRKVAGFLMIALGIIQGAWIFYNVFIEELPQFQKPIIPIGLTTLSFGLIAVGAEWMKSPLKSDKKP